MADGSRGVAPTGVRPAGNTPCPDSQLGKYGLILPRKRGASTLIPQMGDYAAATPAGRTGRTIVIIPLFLFCMVYSDSAGGILPPREVETGDCRPLRRNGV